LKIFWSFAHILIFQQFSIRRGQALFRLKLGKCVISVFSILLAFHVSADHSWLGSLNYPKKQSNFQINGKVTFTEIPK